MIAESTELPMTHPAASPPLRILHLSQSDREGGANRAAYRIHQALRDLGVDSIFHSGRKLGDDPSTVAAWPAIGGRRMSEMAARLNALALRAYPSRRTAPFSPVRLSYGRLHDDLLAHADVVCLHWIAGAFLKPDALTHIGRPLIWRLSDLWPFTGGCHFSGDCKKFEKNCGACPMLGSHRETDLSRLDFRARQRAYRDLNLTIVAPSRWIADQARRSSLFGHRPIIHIPTGVDLATYERHDRTKARTILGLPPDRPILLFGALAATDDPRKGYHHLKGALQHLVSSHKADNALSVIFGGSQDSLAELPLETKHLGPVADETRLAMLYAAADVFVAPFVEDNLPNVILEALACGTPVVAFRVGGIPDAIVHCENGYLAPLGAVEELARGIIAILDADQPEKLRSAARATAAAQFDLITCANRYRDLCASLVASNRVEARSRGL
jgi:glycosyltransferase involved in cell wall biosynthesis